MITPSVKDLHDAITTNSSNVVESYLSQGVNPNQNHASLLQPWTSVVDRHGNVNPTCLVAAHGTRYDSISSLHLAVISCFHHSNNNKNNDALRVFKALLQRGADVTLTMNGMYLGFMVNNKWSLAVAEANMTPLQLAVFFKKHLASTNTPMRQCQECVMNQVTAALLDASKPGGPLTIPASSIPTSVLASWKNMLVSSEFCDVKFACPCGTTFVCHKSVLAASSEYFRTYFVEKWETNHPDNVWNVLYSSEVMWAMLTFLYAGELSASVVNAHATELLTASHEYMLPELYRIAEANCIGNISVETVVNLVQLANVVQSQNLQTACFDFVRANAAQTLTNPNLLALANDNPRLWKKLTAAVSPQKK